MHLPLVMLPFLAAASAATPPTQTPAAGTGESRHVTCLRGWGEARTPE
jgi:hypothetical protein